MLLDKDFYSVSEIAAMKGGSENAAVNIYTLIRQGKLKGRKQYLESAGRVVVALSQKETKRYLKGHCIKVEVAPSITGKTKDQTVMNQRRAIAVAAMKEYLKTFEGDEQNEGIEVVLDALGIERNPEIIAACRQVGIKSEYGGRIWGKAGRRKAKVA